MSEARKPRALNGTAKTKGPQRNSQNQGLNGTATTKGPQQNSQNQGLNRTAKTKASTEQPNMLFLIFPLLVFINIMDVENIYILDKVMLVFMLH